MTCNWTFILSPPHHVNVSGLSMATVEISHNLIDTTESCRFCLMCRHICPVTRVTFNEATSPHGWALAVSSARRGLLEWDAETANLLYQCADCGACQSFCVTDQPLPDAIVAARADLLAQNRPHPALPETMPTRDLGVALEAARALLETLAIGEPLVAPEQDIGLAYTLGLHDMARAAAQTLADNLARGGARRLLVLAPDDAHTLLHIFPRLHVALPDGAQVIELTALLANLLDEGRLRLRRGNFDVAYHDPCQTPRFEGRWRAPRRLLAALTERPIQESFWREQRAASCGASGGLLLTQPRLASDMARAALADATRGGARTVVTEAPGCLAHLRAHAGDDVEVKGLYELLAQHVLSAEG